ncbi:MAG: hypothetical protein HY980_03425 [Candidatus Magasanikbacteria bacterium]|nr:hypothetical protein [Candidatus Magasanikbacteria bacterium]
MIKAKKEDKQINDDKPIQKVESNESGDTLKDLIEKNIKWSQVIYEQNRGIKRRLTMMVLGSYLRLLLIIVPLILAAIYLPPIVKNLLGQYGDLMGGLQGMTKGGQLDVNGILNQVSPDQIQQFMKLLGR